MQQTPVTEYLTMFAEASQGDECWEWPRGRDRDGYGVVDYQDRQWRVPRLSYLTVTGDDPAELMVRHRCDNPPCFRPAHLLLGDALDNARDRKERTGYHPWNKHRPYCDRGHEMTVENTHVRRTDGGRQCKACARASVQRRRTERLKREVQV